MGTVLGADVVAVMVAMSGSGSGTVMRTGTGTATVPDTGGTALASGAGAVTDMVTGSVSGQGTATRAAAVAGAGAGAEGGWLAADVRQGGWTVNAGMKNTKNKQEALQTILDGRRFDFVESFIGAGRGARSGYEYGDWSVFGGGDGAGDDGE